MTLAQVDEISSMRDDLSHPRVVVDQKHPEQIGLKEQGIVENWLLES